MQMLLLHNHQKKKYKSGTSQFSLRQPRYPLSLYSSASVAAD